MSTATATRWHNWARNVEARPVALVGPTSTEELAAVVRDAAENGHTVKAIGAGHSFTSIAATDGVQVNLEGMRGLLSVDRERNRVRLAAGTHLWELPAIFEPLGLAMQNLGDIDRQSIAGAVSTGTHGTGLAFGGIATQVSGLTLVDGRGNTVFIDEHNSPELLTGARIGLGALGVVTEVELQLVPAFQLRAREARESLDAVIDGLDERVEHTDHFEFYWWPHTDVAMTKSNDRLPMDAPAKPVGKVAGYIEDRLLSNGAHRLMCDVGHAFPGLIPPINRMATNVYGSREYTDRSTKVFTHPRTTRFRELEYAVPRAALPAALAELRKAIDRAGLQVSFPVEVRFAAADENWLSTGYGRESAYIAVHRYWRDDHEPLLRLADSVLRGFEGRPHWGKLHWLEADDLRARYPRFDDFLALRNRLDPDRRFRNDYLDRVLGD